MVISVEEMMILCVREFKKFVRRRRHFRGRGVRGANFLLEDNEGESPLSLVHEWCQGEMRELWEEFLFKYYKLHVDLLVFGRAGPAQPRRVVTEFLAAWPTYEDY